MLISQAITQYEQLGYSGLIYLSMKDANLSGPDYTLIDTNQFGEFFKSKVSQPPHALPKAVEEPLHKVENQAKKPCIGSVTQVLQTNLSKVSIELCRDL